MAETKLEPRPPCAAAFPAKLDNLAEFVAWLNTKAATPNRYTTVNATALVRATRAGLAVSTPNTSRANPPGRSRLL